MSRADLQVNFRMPARLKEELEELAKANRRSLTAEIVARLERSVADMDELGISDRDRLEGSYSPAINPDAPMVIKMKVDGPLVSETTSVLPSPNELMRVIGEMAESLRKMAAEMKELKEDRDR